MKGISLWQVWPSLISLGGKKYETRSWATAYRGPLAICSTKSTPAWAYEAAWDEPQIREFLSRHGVQNPRKDLPNGCVVAVATLADCIPITQEFVAGLSPLERAAGNYGPRRFAWEMENVVPLRSPLPFAGRQKLFEVNGVCRICACTDTDCSVCIERTGSPCHWVEPDLCSACAK